MKGMTRAIVFGICVVFIIVGCKGNKGSSGRPNIVISAATNHQLNPQIVSDGSGGAIITWEDYRSGTNYNIYAQRINSSGTVQWTANGVSICTVLNHQEYPQLVSDGSGGAIITWRDYRSGTNYDIYAQRINSSGTVQWIADGVAVCTFTMGQLDPQIISDGSGGAIITWEDARSGIWDIYAQRVNSAGAPQWTADGVSVCTAANSQSTPQLVSDDSGGAIITWEDARSGNIDIYAQRINNSGIPQWTADGVSLCTAGNDQWRPQIVSDGSGGAIITWYDWRSGNTDIYAQRVNSSGVVQWATDGVAVCTAANGQYIPQIVSDGSGGAIITWHDWRGGNTDIYVQRVNSSGVVQWATNGVAVCTSANDQYTPQIVSDDSGGAIITWQDNRSGNTDIYVQRVNSSGVVQWATDGVAVCMAANSQGNPQIVSDGSGGAIITWHDWRNGNGDIYAQGVSASGRQ